MFAHRLALAIAVLAGLIGSQGPEFTQQYRQRLGGALEELNRIVAEFDAEAGRENLTRARGFGPARAQRRPFGPRPRRRHAQGDRSRPASQRADRGHELRRSAHAPLCGRDQFRSSDRAQHARQLRTRRASVVRRACGGRARRPWGMGGDAPHRLAVPPRAPVVSGPRAPNRRRPTSDRRAAQVKSNVEGLAAIIAAVTPVRVRLSPSESEIVRPDTPLAAWASTAASSSASDMPAVR